MSSEETEPEKVTLRGRETILLVDDEKGIMDVVGEMIKGLGYQLMTAESGEEAVDIYPETLSAIDLVIMDMIMPGLGGGAAIDAIRADKSAGQNYSVQRIQSQRRGAGHPESRRDHQLYAKAVSVDGPVAKNPGYSGRFF